MCALPVLSIHPPILGQHFRWLQMSNSHIPSKIEIIDRHGFLLLLLKQIQVVGVGYRSKKFGAVRYKIPGECEIDVYCKALQPFTTIVVVCPGVDGIRI